MCLYLFCDNGRLPFYGQSELEIQIASKQNELKIQEHFSAELKEVIKATLDKDPNKRPTAEALL